MSYATRIGILLVSFATTAIAGCGCRESKPPPVAASSRGAGSDVVAAPALPALPPPWLLPKPAIVWERAMELDPRLHVAGGMVLGREGEDVIALDSQTGALSWRTIETGSLWTAEDVQLLFFKASDKAGVRGALTAREPKKGGVLWRHESSCAGLLHVSHCGARTIMVGFEAGTGARVIVALDFASGDEQWRVPAPSGTVVLMCGADTVYVYRLAEDGQHVSACDAGTGQERWSARLPGYLSTVIPAGDLVLVADDKATRALRALDGGLAWSRTHEVDAAKYEPRKATIGGQLVVPWLGRLGGLEGERSQLVEAWLLPTPPATFRRQKGLAVTTSAGRVVASLGDDAGQPGPGGYLFVWEPGTETPRIFGEPADLSFGVVVGDVIVEPTKTGVRALSLTRPRPKSPPVEEVQSVLLREDAISEAMIEELRAISGYEALLFDAAADPGTAGRVRAIEIIGVLRPPAGADVLLRVLDEIAAARAEMRRSRPPPTKRQGPPTFRPPPPGRNGARAAMEAAIQALALYDRPDIAAKVRAFLEEGGP